MGTEIERKFLVQGDAWRQGAQGERITQGYIVNEKARSVRVRRYGERAFLTIKGAASGLARPEFEYEIPPADAEALLRDFCGGSVIDKTRWLVAHAGHDWEVDEFHGANQGLVVAELELSGEDEAFERPAWLGEEVSHDERFLNASLVRKPYSTWGQKA